LIQSEAGDRSFRKCQVQVDVTNLSGTLRYVAAQDFALLDATGREWRFDPGVSVHLADGLSGTWVAPGQTWSGWLQRERGEAAARGITFVPDGMTRIELRVIQ
jgi:hypothetical protein